MMVTMKAILTSSLGGQVKIDGKRLPAKLPETNGLLKCIKDSWKNDSKVMIISGSPEYYDQNDSVSFCLKGAFSLSNLSASEVLMCDERNKEIIERLPEMDVLILAGGHVPTQNSFLKTIGLKERLQAWDGLRLIEDITYADSMGHEIIALNNGSFIVADNGTETLYGEAYSIKDGEQKQICTDDKWIRL